MAIHSKRIDASAARVERRQRIVQAARALDTLEAEAGFDPVHSPLSAIDVVLIAGAPWLRDGLERDFYKDESGYRKIGGGANTPAAAYFFRSANNLIHYLKRQGLYSPRGASEVQPGMACFFDWEDRGRFNFAPDRTGIVLSVKEGLASEVILAVKGQNGHYRVECVEIHPGDVTDRALIGFSDLP